MDKVFFLESGILEKISVQTVSPRFCRSLRFFICQIFEEMCYPNLQNVVWRRHIGVSLRGMGAAANWARNLPGFCLNNKRVLTQRHDLGPVSIVIEYCFAEKHLFFLYISFAKLIFSWSNRATYRRAGRSLFDSSEFETDNFLERT